MPFAAEHLDTYDTIVRAVAKANKKLRITRVDDKPGAFSITDEIRRAIRTAGLIICDLTEERPNVYYELGLAHGLDRPVICIARKSTRLHFDVYGLKVIFFDTYRLLEQELERETAKMLVDMVGGNKK